MLVPVIDQLLEGRYTPANPKVIAFSSQQHFAVCRQMVSEEIQQLFVIVRIVNSLGRQNEVIFCLRSNQFGKLLPIAAIEFRPIETRYAVWLVFGIQADIRYRETGQHLLVLEWN